MPSTNGLRCPVGVYQLNSNYMLIFDRVADVLDDLVGKYDLARESKAEFTMQGTLRSLEGAQFIKLLPTICSDLVLIRQSSKPPLTICKAMELARVC